MSELLEASRMVYRLRGHLKRRFLFELSRFRPGYPGRLLLSILVFLSLLVIAAGQVMPKRNVLIINELGHSHCLSPVLTQMIITGVEEESSRQVELHESSLWERTKWIWVSLVLMILSLAALVIYLQSSRKQLQLARERHRQLSGMLIHAEEQERSRVATELHDDFSQRLAVLALKLGNVADNISPLSKEAEQEMQELLNAVSELVADLHTLSHRLHSSTLERLGLVPGIQSLCKEFSSQTGLRIEFSPENIPPSVSPDAALCLFRIIQEALRNVKKHSGATSAQVKISQEGEQLHLTVSDAGNGFELRELQSQNGLGVHSMEERVSALGGKFAIRSSRNEGTTVEALLPLDARVGRARGHA